MENDSDNTQAVTQLTGGVKVAHYNIIEKIGAGGMGEIYLANDTKLDRKVALKFMPANLISNKELKSRFIREAKAVAKLSHPNIVTVFEVGEFNNRPFFAMDYIKGKTLQQLVIDSSLIISNITDLSIQLCQGLGEAHRNGIIHRDIKTSNIIVDEQGRLRILDFGLAAMTGSEELTKTGSTLGTVAYMSPEQVSGRTADKRSDLFSFGVVLYELIASKTPFCRDNDGATLQAIMSDNPEPVSRYKDNVPELLEQVINKLLEKNIELRYQSAEGVLADLKRLLYDSQQTTGTVKMKTVDDNSIVVLPFANMSADKDNEYFSDGLTEELITDLSSISKMRVISRNSTMKLKDTKKDMPTIGRELNVRYILTGSVRKAGNNVRITSQLVEASTNQQIWADKYKGTLEDIFEIQEEVSQSIVATLKVKLTSVEKQKITEHPIENIKAYECYLRARQEIYKWDDKLLDKAKAYLLEGLEHAGPNALLYTGLAHIYFQYVNMGLKGEEYLIKSKEYLDKALTLNPDLPYAHIVLGLRAQSEIGAKDKSIKHLIRALKLEPNNTEALGWAALELSLLGKNELAYKLIHKSIRLDPLAVGLKGSLSFIQCMDGKFDEYLETIKDIYNKNSDSYHPRLRMLFAHSFLGLTDEATKFKQKFPGNTYYERLNLLLYYGALGEPEKGISLLTKEDYEATKRDSQYSLYFAIGFAICGKKDETLEWLENALDHGFINYPYVAKHDPHFRKFDDDERFQALLTKFKAEYEAFSIEIDI